QVDIYQSNVTLSITVTAPGQAQGFPISFRWQTNGINIQGTTSSNYTLFVDTPYLGTYSVIVSNAAGATTVSWQVTMTYVGSYIEPGTLAYYLSTNIVARAAAFTPTPSNMVPLSGWSSNVYSGTNIFYLTNSTWSTNFWLAGVQGLSATCIGYSNGTA